jgi:hypothetical protein
MNVDAMAMTMLISNPGHKRLKSFRQSSARSESEAKDDCVMNATP